MIFLKNMQNLKSQPAGFLHTHEYAVCSYFNGVGLQMIAFTADVSAIGHAEFVTVGGAYYIAQGVNESIGHDAAGMRTEIGKCKKFILEPCNTNLFIIAVYDRNVIGIENQFLCICSDPEPFYFPSHQVKNSDLYG